MQYSPAFCGYLQLSLGSRGFVPTIYRGFQYNKYMARNGPFNVPLSCNNPPYVAGTGLLVSDVLGNMSRYDDVVCLPYFEILIYGPLLDLLVKIPIYMDRYPFVHSHHALRSLFWILSPRSPETSNSKNPYPFWVLISCSLCRSSSVPIFLNQLPGPLLPWTYS